MYGCPGYLDHPFRKQRSLKRFDVVGRRIERRSHGRNACFGTDNPDSQDTPYNRLFRLNALGFKLPPPQDALAQLLE